MPPQRAASLALRVAIAGAYRACTKLGHRIADNIASDDRPVADAACRELAELGVTGDDLVGEMATASRELVKAGSLAERTLSMSLLAAEVYILARHADAIGVLLAHGQRSALASTLTQLDLRLASACESLGSAIARFEEVLDSDAVSPAVHDAARKLAMAAAMAPPAWSAPEAAQLYRPGASWSHGIREGLRELTVALGYPVERAAAPVSRAELDVVDRILAHPDDDALRSEWLELAAARGEVRAELARAQMQARAERRRDPTRLHFDPPIVDSMLGRHPEWKADVQNRGAIDAALHRGFVESIDIDAAVLLARAPELFGVAPILHVRLRGDPAFHLEALLVAGHLERMLSIDLSHQQLDDHHAELLASYPLVSLRALHLDGNRIGAAGARALYASESLRELAYLSLGGNPCGPLAELAWTHHELPTQIVELTPLGAQLATELGERKYLHRLEAPSVDVLTAL